MITDSPSCIWSNPFSHLIEVIHIHIRQRVTYDSDPIYIRKRAKKVAMPFDNARSLFLRIGILTLEVLTSKVCSIIPYWQTPIPFTFFLKEIRQIH